MPLSITPLERWDFQKPSAQLVGDVNGHTLTGANISFSAGEGMIINPALTSPGAFINAPLGTLLPTFPYTIVIAARFPATERSMNFGTIIGFSDTDAVFSGIGGDYTPNADPAAVVQFNVPAAGGWNQSPYGAATVAEGVETVLIAEFTTTTRRLWVNGVLTVNQSGSFATIPSAMFHIARRGNGVWMIDFNTPFCAVFNGTLTAGDVAALGSSYASARSALFGGARLRPYLANLLLSR